MAACWLSDDYYEISTAGTQPKIAKMLHMRSRRFVFDELLGCIFSPSMCTVIAKELTRVRAPDGANDKF